MCLDIREFHSSVYNQPLDGTRLYLTMHGQVCAIWKVLAKQSIGIFVCASLPCTARQAMLASLGGDPKSLTSVCP